MNYKKWNREETQRKHADTLINMGEKFYYASFMMPIAILIKFENINYALISTALSIIIIGGIGVFFQQRGLAVYDEIMDAQ